MSGLPVSSSITSHYLSPTAEFRRWLVIAAVLAIIGGCISLVDLSRLWLAYLYWLLFTAVEGWVQFDSWRRRVAWSMAGFGVFFLLFRLDGRDGPFFDFLYLIPAFLECVIARGERRRPWIWLIATPTIYGFADFWSVPLRSVADWLTPLISKTFNFSSAIRSDVTNLAIFFAAIMITRAAVGSFIASRKQPNPG